MKIAQQNIEKAKDSKEKQGGDTGRGEMQPEYGKEEGTKGMRNLRNAGCIS